jgi:hypothetical protein
MIKLLGLSLVLMVQIAVLSIGTPVSVSAAEIIRQSIGTPLNTSSLKKGQIIYGYTSKFIPYNEWNSATNDTAMPLNNLTKFNHAEAEVFETRAAAIVSKPVTYFTEEYLHNINTVKKLNPQNKHRVIQGNGFSVETIVPFPLIWEAFFIAAQKFRAPNAKPWTPYIKMTSTFIYASRQAIETRSDVQNIINRLGLSERKVRAINLQATTDINEIADFATFITVFCELENNQTLVVSYSAMAVKTKTLGLTVPTTTVKGRDVMLGKGGPVINTSSGIGAGLPIYSLELFDDMIRGFEN